MSYHSVLHNKKTSALPRRKYRSGVYDAMDIIISGSLAILLYLNTLQAEFAYDDSRAILKNPDIRPENALSNLFINDFWGTPLQDSGSHKSYRPLCVLTFRLNYYLGQLDPYGYHLFNVVLHSLVTCLFTYTARQLLQTRYGSTMAGLLFSAHPIHTEAVAGVVGRADILAALFFLLALLCYIRYCKYREECLYLVHGGGSVVLKWTCLLGSSVCTVAALLSKEHGITVLVVCTTYDLFIQSRLTIPKLYKVHEWPSLEGVFCMSALGVCCLTLRIYVMGSTTPEFAPADNPASDSNSLLTRTLTFLYLPVLNFYLLLYPYTLSFDWSMEAVPLIQHLTDIRNLATLAFYSVILYVIWTLAVRLNIVKYNPNKKPVTNGHNGDACSIYKVPSTCSRRFLRRESTSSSESSEDGNNLVLSPTTKITTAQTLTMGLVIAICPFIPATNLFFYVGFVIAERVLYIPSMGYVLTVAHGIELLRQYYCVSRGKQKLLYAILTSLLLAFSLKTLTRNMDWRTEENLYRSGLNVNPAKAWGNLANILNSQGKVEEAEEAYKQALTYRGNMADVHYNLGILLQDQKRHHEAIDSYRKAIQCRPRLSMAHLNLGIVLTAIGRKYEAVQIYRHCANLDTTGLKDPRLHEHTRISALYNLGRLYADLELYQDAVNVYIEAISRRPSHYKPQSLYNMLGEAYSKLGADDKAEHWYREALKVKATHIPAHLTMARLKHKQGKLFEAEDWFVRAKTIAPNDGSVYQHYAQFLSETRRFQEAAENYKLASALLPDDFELIFNTANAFRQAGNGIEAEKLYKHAVELRPRDHTAHMNLGAMLHYNGKLMEAEHSYMTSLKLKPNDPITTANLNKLRNLMAKNAGK